jgi:hypothetical protein
MASRGDVILRECGCDADRDGFLANRRVRAGGDLPVAREWLCCFLELPDYEHLSEPAGETLVSVVAWLTGLEL